MGAASAAVALACFVCFVSTGGVRNHLDLARNRFPTGIDDFFVAVRKGIARGQKFQAGMGFVLFILMAQTGIKGTSGKFGRAIERDTILKFDILLDFQVRPRRNRQRILYGNVFQNQRTGLIEGQLGQVAVINLKGMALEIIQNQFRIYIVVLQFQGSVTIQCPDIQIRASCIVLPQIQCSGEPIVQGERSVSILSNLDGNAVLRDKGTILRTQLATPSACTLFGIQDSTQMVAGDDFHKFPSCSSEISATGNPTIDPSTISSGAVLILLQIIRTQRYRVGIRYYRILSVRHPDILNLSLQFRGDIHFQCQSCGSLVRSNLNLPIFNSKRHIYNNRNCLTGLPQGQGHLIDPRLSIPSRHNRDRCSILGYCRSQVRILRRKGDFQGIQIPILASNRERRRTIHPIKKLSILFTNGKGDFLPVFPLCHGHGGIGFQNTLNRRLLLFRLFLGFSLGFFLGLSLFRFSLGLLALFVLRGGLRLGLLILRDNFFLQGLGPRCLLREDGGGQHPDTQCQGQNQIDDPFLHGSFSFCDKNFQPSPGGRCPPRRADEGQAPLRKGSCQP